MKNVKNMYRKNTDDVLKNVKLVFNNFKHVLEKISYWYKNVEWKVKGTKRNERTNESWKNEGNKRK